MSIDDFFGYALSFPDQSFEEKKLILDIQQRLQNEMNELTVHGRLLKPGTILRSDEACSNEDTDFKSKSVTFTCFPYCHFIHPTEKQPFSRTSFPEGTLLQALHPFQSTAHRDNEQTPRVLLNDTQDHLVVNQFWSLSSSSCLLTYSTVDPKLLFKTGLEISDFEKVEVDQESYLVKVTDESGHRFITELPKKSPLFELEARLWQDYVRKLENSNSRLTRKSFLPQTWQLYEDISKAKDGPLHKGATMQSQRSQSVRAVFTQFHQTFSSIQKHWHSPDMDQKLVEFDITLDKDKTETHTHNELHCKPLMFLATGPSCPSIKPQLNSDDTFGDDATLLTNLETLTDMLKKKNLISVPAYNTASPPLLTYQNRPLLGSPTEATSSNGPYVAKDVYFRRRNMMALPKPESIGTARSDAIQGLSSAVSSTPAIPEPDLNGKLTSKSVIISWEQINMAAIVKAISDDVQSIVSVCRQILDCYLPRGYACGFTNHYGSIIDSILLVSQLRNQFRLCKETY
jgi:hypothetical protein